MAWRENNITLATNKLSQIALLDLKEPEFRFLYHHHLFQVGWLGDFSHSSSVRTANWQPG